MTALDLDAIEKRANAAQSDPWMGSFNAAAWTEFVAHAREDIPALVAEVRRLRAQLETPMEWQYGWRMHRTGECYPIWGAPQPEWFTEPQAGYEQVRRPVGEWEPIADEPTPEPIPGVTEALSRLTIRPEGEKK